MPLRRSASCGLVLLLGLCLHSAAALEAKFDFSGPFSTYGTPDDCDSAKTGTNGATIAELTDGLYDRMVQPGQYKTTPGVTDVQMNFYINQIYDFNEKGEHYKVVGYLRQSWNDPRLAWTDTGKHCWGDQISIPPEQYKNIWRPDIFFSNSLAETFGGSNPNMGLRDGRTTVSKNGDVFASHLVKLHVTCPLIFGKMPFDKQFCPLKIESYWDTSDQVRFSVYNDLPVELNPTASIGGFTVMGGSGKAIVTEFSTGKFSALVLEMQLERDRKFHLFAVIFPACLFVLCCYLSFWIDRKVAPARVAMALLPLLIIVTQMSGVNNSLPRLNYSVWLQDFMLMCLFFAGTPTIEYLFLAVCMMWEFEKNQTVQKLKGYEKECAEALKESIFHSSSGGKNSKPSTRLMKQPKPPPSDANDKREKEKDRDSTPSWWSSRHSRKSATSVPRGGTSTMDDVAELQELSQNGHVGISIDDPPPYPASNDDVTMSEPTSSTRSKSPLMRRKIADSKRKGKHKIASGSADATPVLFDDPELSDKISGATIKSLRKIFGRFDTNGSGEISIKELTAMFGYLWQRPTKKKMEEIMVRFGTQAKDAELLDTQDVRKETMSFEEFIVFVAHSSEYMTRNIVTRVDGAKLVDQPFSYIIERVMRVVYLPMFVGACIIMFSISGTYKEAVSVLA